MDDISKVIPDLITASLVKIMSAVKLFINYDKFPQSNNQYQHIVCVDPDCGFRALPLARSRVMSRHSTPAQDLSLPVIRR